MIFSLASCMADSSESPVVAAFTDHATVACLGGHSLTQDADAAEAILFVDLHLCPDANLTPLRSHPLTREMARKVLVYDERDEPWCAFPGVYVSMPRRQFDPNRQRAFGYYASNPSTTGDPTAAPDLLFSFVGSPGHATSRGYRVRQELLKVRHPRTVVEDSSGFVFYDDKGDPAAHRQRQERFAGVMCRSKFMACPRGRGTSSIRMYEALRAGRVPIVLADDWVAPAGPDWGTIAISLPEREAHHIAAVAATHEDRWPEMSRRAREAYDNWFAPSVAVRRIFDLCEDLLRSPQPPASPWWDAGYRAMRARVAKHRVRSWAGASLRTLGIKR